MSKQRNNENSNYLNPQACILCCSDDDNEILMGKFISSDDIRVHTYCVFFASGLCQQGGEEEGVLGFLVPDIEAEVRRGRKLVCSYCRKRGATIGCCVAVCKKSFHLNCGMQHGSLHQFYGSFLSYCKQHKPVQRPVVPYEYYCSICCEDIKSDEVEFCIYPPCCKKNLFHKLCLQMYALSAGVYFMKCPLCNDTDQFIEEMRTYGINIPERDASWELEDNAYQDLLIRPECNARNCLCPRGRKYCPRKQSGWTLVICSCCGFHARHKNCCSIKSENRWMCEECSDLNDKILKNKAISEIPRVVLEDLAKTSLYSGIHNDTLLNSANMSPRKWEPCQSHESDNKPPVKIEAFKVNLPVEIDASEMEQFDVQLPVEIEASEMEQFDVQQPVEIEASEIEQFEVQQPVEIEASEMEQFDNVVDTNSVQFNEVKTNDDDDLNLSEIPIVPGPSFCNSTNNRKASLIPVINRAANLRDIKNVQHNMQVQTVKNFPKRKKTEKITKRQKLDQEFLKECILCRSKDQNEVLMGKFIISGDICTHSNCLFFASGLNRRGYENDIFFGVLPQDITAEFHRGKKTGLLLLQKERCYSWLRFNFLQEVFPSKLWNAAWLFTSILWIFLIIL